MSKLWHTSHRVFDVSEKPLVMAILNVTPDSFSDGGKFFAIDAALRQAENLIAEGADILDIGGESTRPNSRRVSVEEETRRTAPLIEAIAKRFDVAVSIDTSKAEVAKAAVDAGAEIINDISGLKFDENIAAVAARTKAGLILMHLRGTFETMHKLPPIEDVMQDVSDGFRWSVEKARSYGVEADRIALDIGIGFSKMLAQNLELIANLDKIIAEFKDYPMLVGASRKSFIGKVLGGAQPEERINGSLASAVLAVWNGAHIVRVHDVKATVEAVKLTEAIKRQRKI